jgi:hypothetical protein
LTVARILTLCPSSDFTAVLSENITVEFARLSIIGIDIEFTCPSLFFASQAATFNTLESESESIYHPTTTSKNNVSKNSPVFSLNATSSSRTISLLSQPNSPIRNLHFGWYTYLTTLIYHTYLTLYGDGFHHHQIFYLGSSLQTIDLGSPLWVFRRRRKVLVLGIGSLHGGLRLIRRFGWKRRGLCLLVVGTLELVDCGEGLILCGAEIG